MIILKMKEQLWANTALFFQIIVNFKHKLSFFCCTFITSFKQLLKNLLKLHCVKSICIWSFSGPYSVTMMENTDQKNTEYGHFPRYIRSNVYWSVPKKTLVNIYDETFFQKCFMAKYTKKNMERKFTKKALLLKGFNVVFFYLWKLF